MAQRPFNPTWMEQPWALARGQKEKTPLWLRVSRRKKKEVQVTAGQVLVEMHVTDWAAAPKEDPELDAVLLWLEAEKKTDLRTLLGELASSKES